MKKFKKLQIKRQLSLLLAAGMLGCLGPFCGPKTNAVDGDLDLPLNMFAAKDELTCSWGPTLNEAKNQKLNLGIYPDDGGDRANEPLQWWICKNDGATAYLYAATPIPYSSTEGGDRLWHSAEDVAPAENEYGGNYATPIASNWNEWATSDVRAYLNPGLTANAPSPLSNGKQNCATGASNAFPSGATVICVFADDYLPNSGERALLLPETVNTPNFPNTNAFFDYSYLTSQANQIVTKDFFWLPIVPQIPAGNTAFTQTDCLHWAGVANVSDVIPYQYQTGGDYDVDTSSNTPGTWPLTKTFSWLRSPHPQVSTVALVAASAGAIAADDVSDSEYYPAVAPVCKIDLASVEFASAAPSADIMENEGFFDISDSVSEVEEDPIADRTPGMYLRFGSDNVPKPTISEDKKTITGRVGDTITIQGVTGNGQNWSYSKKLEDQTRVTTEEITVDEVNAAGYDNGVFATDAELTSFADVKVWAEILGIGDQEGLLLTSATPKDNIPNPPTPGEPGNGVNSPPTGDNLQTWLWLGGAGIGMISVGVAIFYRTYRKRRRV